MENLELLGSQHGGNAPSFDEEQGELLQRAYQQTIPHPAVNHGFYEFIISLAGYIQGFLGAIPCCICLPNPYKAVDQGHVGLLERFGKCIQVVDPGLQFINPWCENLRQVSIKLRLADVPRQYVMTKDNVGLHIDSVLTYRVVDPYAATYLVANVHEALIERTQTTLRQIVGKRSIQECIEHRDTLAAEIAALIEPPAKSWGTEVDCLLVKDIELPSDIRDSMSAAARQRKIGEGWLIAAEADVLAAQLMKRASDVLSTPTAMQMRFLETLQGMSKSSGTKIIFAPEGSDSASIKNLASYNTAAQTFCSTSQ